MSKSKRLSQWAKDNGYSYQGAYEMYARGQLPNASKLPSGSIIVRDDVVVSKPIKTVIYARVSTPKQKDDLDRQADRLIEFCKSRGLIIDRVVKEIASGLNDNRPKLNSILTDDSITTVVVENKDRLTRFGFNYIETHLNSKDCDLIVVDRHTEQEQDLIQDFVSIITSMAARVYGNRRGKQKSQKIIEILDDTVEAE